MPFRQGFRPLRPELGIGRERGPEQAANGYRKKLEPSGPRGIRTALSRCIQCRLFKRASAAHFLKRFSAAKWCRAKKRYFFFFLAAFFLGAFLAAAFFFFLATVRPPKKMLARSVSVTSKSLDCSERVLPEQKTKPSFVKQQVASTRENFNTPEFRKDHGSYLYTFCGYVQHES